MSKEIFAIVVLLITGTVLIARGGYLLEKESSTYIPSILGGVLSILAVCGLFGRIISIDEEKEFKVEPGERIEETQILIKGQDTTRWFNVIKEEGWQE